MPYEEEASEIIGMMELYQFKSDKSKTLAELIGEYLDVLVAQEVEEALANQHEPIGEPLDYSELD